MAEDSAGYDNEALIAGLEEGDLKPHFYEGGFKTWECALDLAKLVTVEELSVNGYLASADAQTDVHIIEVCTYLLSLHVSYVRHICLLLSKLGAGTAVPSLALFTRILGQPGDQNAPPQRRTHFTFADYNSAVLRLVTLPNLLLTWYHSCPQSSAPLTTSTSSAQQPQDEELDITTELLETFTNDLARRSITVDFLSGAWSPELVDLIFNTSPAGNRRTLVLASETIYSPSSLISFSETLLGVLRRADAASTAASRALVAAKKVYFGIGGGVDEFLAVLTNLCGNELDVRPRIDVQSEGVGRVILELMRAVHRCFPQMI